MHQKQKNNLLKKTIVLLLFGFMFTFSNCPPPNGYCLWKCEYNQNHFAYTKINDNPPVTNEICIDAPLDENGYAQVHYYYFVSCDYDK